MTWLRSAGALSVIASLSLSTGCATMFSSEKQDIKLRAYPEDATVAVDNKPAPSSNAVLPLARDKVHYVDVSREGYQSKRVTVSQGLNPWFFANILWGPFFWVGMLVDAMTGYIHELEPTNLTINLVAAQPGSAGPLASASSPSSGSSSAGGLSAGGPSIDPAVMSSGSANKTTPQPATKAAEPTKPAPAVAPTPQAVDTRARVPRTMVRDAQKEWVVAVMNVGTTGKAVFEKNILSALTDQIRVYLAERGARVVDRSAQEAALKGIVEEEKKKSYAACVDSSCQIPLGKALAASHILRSTVARFGKACATNGELIDLRAEVTVAAGSARGECGEEDLLLAAENLAEQLIAGSAR